ncbi:MAG: tRNA dihydrouridine synthase DusB [Terriglobia bacterium]
MIERYAQWQVGGRVLRPATVLAPMAGVTDNVFRRLIREQSGCGLLITEFTSADGLLKANARTRRYLYFTEDEHPIEAQLFGANPETLAEAAALVESLGFDLVDINLGCPAKKVVKCGGSGLLRDLPWLEKILRRVRAAVRIPLTIKIRAGWDENSIVVREVGRLAEDCGVEAIALHPRTRVQGYSAAADWGRIAELKETVRIPVVGNGDVHRPEDAARMFRETGCDAVMIGRAAVANPWLFRQMADYFSTGRYSEPTEEDRYRLLQEFYRRLLAPAAFLDGKKSAGQAGEHPEALGRMKQFASRFTHGLRHGGMLRRAIHAARTPAEVMDRVEAFFSQIARGPAARRVPGEMPREACAADD